MNCAIAKSVCVGHLFTSKYNHLEYARKGGTLKLPVYTTHRAQIGHFFWGIFAQRAGREHAT
jgi:hypothetical protein